MKWIIWTIHHNETLPAFIIHIYCILESLWFLHQADAFSVRSTSRFNPTIQFPWLSYWVVISCVCTSNAFVYSFASKATHSRYTYINHTVYSSRRLVLTYHWWVYGVISLHRLIAPSFLTLPTRCQFYDLYRLQFSFVVQTVAISVYITARPNAANLPRMLPCKVQVCLIVSWRLLVRPK